MILETFETYGKTAHEKLLRRECLMNSSTA